MNPIMQKSKFKKVPLNFVAAAGLLVLAGCASEPRAPTEALQAAEISISNAEQARVADYASPELTEAREKLAAARSEAQAKKMVVAERLAQQSRVDAELAIAKAGAARAKVVNYEMLKGTDVMKQEMQRNTGDTQ
jgi:hypothetical protein